MLSEEVIPYTILYFRCEQNKQKEESLHFVKENSKTLQTIGTGMCYHEIVIVLNTEGAKEI